MKNENALVGEELYYKFEDLKEDDDYCRQDRVYECGYDCDYLSFFEALAEAYKTKLEDIYFEFFTEYDVPFTIFEAGKWIKINHFYSTIIDNLIKNKIDFAKAFKIIKSLGLKINYENLYLTGFITDPLNIDENDEYIRGKELIKKISDEDGIINYAPQTIIDCGYILFDENDNECPDAIKFFEEVFKEKEINFDEVQLGNFKIHEFREEIEYELDSESKYFAFDWVCFENIPDLEIYKLCESISVEVHIIEPKEHSKDSDINRQEFLPFDNEDNEDKENEDYGYLPAGRYWIGDLTYVMDYEDYFEKNLCEVEGIAKTDRGVNLARFETANGDGFFYDYENNQYGVDAGNIGCIEAKGVSEESELGQYHLFDRPFQCIWHEVGGYIQFGDVWIQTDNVNNFFLPPQMFTLKGKASLEFGKKFLKNDKSISEIANKSSDYWIEKAREIKFGDITDKVVGEIYRIKSKILLDEYDPKRSFEVLVNNHGSSQVSESFWRLFKEEYDFDEDEANMQIILKKILSFID